MKNCHGLAAANPLHKESSGRLPCHRRAQRGLVVGKTLGLSLADQALAPLVEAAYTASLGRKTGSISLPPTHGPSWGCLGDGVEPGHTQSQPGVAEMVRMLLSFQRPSHLFGEGIPLVKRARPGTHNGLRPEAD